MKFRAKYADEVSRRSFLGLRFILPVRTKHKISEVETSQTGNFISNRRRKRNSDKRSFVPRRRRPGSAGRMLFCPPRLAIFRDQRRESLWQIYPGRGRRRQTRLNRKMKECASWRWRLASPAHIAQRKLASLVRSSVIFPAFGRRRPKIGHVRPNAVAIVADCDRITGNQPRADEHRKTDQDTAHFDWNV